MKKKINWRDIILLQLVIIIYTASSIAAKMASGKEMFSVEFFFFYGCEFLVLAVYAIFWQQIIKKFDLSIAYANRAMVLVWSMIWAAFLFHDHVTLKNIVGVIFIVCGTIIVNSEATSKKGDKL